jgi:predicted DCC family thiol-disulfide oxidoreductase YuxK
VTDLVVWHDGDCPLCRREIALMRRLDRRGAITFVDATDPDASCPIDRRDLLARFHAREDGTMLSGAAAFAALRLLEHAYLGFLVVRPRLQAALRGRQAGERRR